MPNWTYNTVIMKGIAKKKELFTNGDFDFNNLISEPQTKEECLLKYKGDKYIDYGDKHLSHDEDKDWFDWYSWHCDFWGTKWNACDTYVVSDDEVHFSTAWSEPEPIWMALSKKYPTEEIQIIADYEEGFVTESTYLNGVRTSYKEYEEEYCDE